MKGNVSKSLIGILALGIIIGIGLTVKTDLMQTGCAQQKVEPIEPVSREIFNLEKQTIKVAEKVGKAVVSISTEVTEKVGGYYSAPFDSFRDDFFSRFFEDFFGRMPEREFKRRGLGSGVIIRENGYILTNQHVVAGSDKIKVKLSDGRELDAEITGEDVRSDLAVIKVAAKNLPSVSLSTDTDLKIGQWVLAVGNPFAFAIGGTEPTVTMGVISAIHRNLPSRGGDRRNYSGLIQTDAAINPGNSGGPLVNLKGEVIGINVAIITTTGGYQGLGFAIPVSKAKKIIGKLLKGEEVEYGWLGVSIQDLNEDLQEYFGLATDKGVIVVSVFEDSPADTAGIQEGDLILTLNGERITQVQELVDKIGNKEPGASVNLGIRRKQEKINIKVQLTKRPGQIGPALTAEKEAVFRGMQVENITGRIQKDYRHAETEGVVVVSVEPGTPADEAGITPSDRIISIEGKKIKDTGEFIEVTQKIKGNCLVRTGRGFFVIKPESE